MTGGQNQTVYQVQIRTKSGNPAKVGDQTIAGNWTTLKVIQGIGIGVKSHGAGGFAESLGYYDYPAAKALQYWTLTEKYNFDVETRIVSSKFNMNYSVEEFEAEEPITRMSLKFTKENS